MPVTETIVPTAPDVVKPTKRYKWLKIIFITDIIIFFSRTVFKIAITLTKFKLRVPKQNNRIERIVPIICVIK